jgi:hypothetical protein
VRDIVVTASKERQTGAKSCKAGKGHCTFEIASFSKAGKTMLAILNTY